jgi:hypothetical protein
MSRHPFTICTRQTNTLLLLLSLCFLFYGCTSQVPPKIIDNPPQNDVSPTKLIDKTPQHSVFPSEPQLRLNPAMHTAMINQVDTDRLQRFAVTASDDKSVLVWALASG